MVVANILVSCLLCVLHSQINNCSRDIEKTVPLEQKYALYGIPVKKYAPRKFSEGVVEVCAEQIEEEDNISPEQVLTMPRPLKRTYAVAGQ